MNAYTQFLWRGKGVKADYEAIRAVMRAIRQGLSGCRIGYPCIGAGLAGGDWAIIGALINEGLAGLDPTLVEYLP